MKRHAIQPANRLGHWIVNYTKYYEHSADVVSELEALLPQLAARRPADSDPQVSEAEATPEVRALHRRRDRLADSAKIFSAMAVESFLNLYGVIRLGEKTYTSRLERLGLVRKLTMLLLLCESLEIQESHPLYQVTAAISSRRNRLVHPRAREYDSTRGPEQTHGDVVPDAAQAALADLRRFFELFREADPGARDLVKLVLQAR